MRAITVCCSSVFFNHIQYWHHSDNIFLYKPREQLLLKFAMVQLHFLLHVVLDQLCPLVSDQIFWLQKLYISQVTMFCFQYLIL